MLQSCRRHWLQNGREFDYAGLMAAAAEARGLQHLVIPIRARLSRQTACPTPSIASAPGPISPVPATPGEYARAILDSLAMKYRLVLRDLETVIGRQSSKSG